MKKGIDISIELKGIKNAQESVEAVKKALQELESAVTKANEDLENISLQSSQKAHKSY